MSSIKFGIAIYPQFMSRNRPTGPHWALVAHPTSFDAEDIKIFQIRRKDWVWILAHAVPGCQLSKAPTLLGVLDLGTVHISMESLIAIVSRFGATKDGYDPSGNIVWGCAGWVIRVLEDLAKKDFLGLGMGVESVYDHTLRRVQALKGIQKRAGIVTIAPF